jgi:hypothetical protein
MKAKELIAPILVIALGVTWLLNVRRCGPVPDDRIGLFVAPAARQTAD